MKKSTQTETLSQARYWDAWKNKYLDAGLCTRCAAQAAWGHQIGFLMSHDPCSTCQPVVDSLPVKKAGRWRGLKSEGAWS